MSSVVLALLLGLSWGLPSGPVTGEETWGFSMMMAGIKRRADERSYERIGAEATCASDLRMSLSFASNSPHPSSQIAIRTRQCQLEFTCR